MNSLLAVASLAPGDKVFYPGWTGPGVKKTKRIVEKVENIGPGLMRVSFRDGTSADLFLSQHMEGKKK